MSALARGRNLGIMGTGQLLDARLRWAVGGFVRDDGRRQADESVRGYNEDVELAGRISYLDLTDEDVRGGREFNLTLGLNWYPLTRLRVGFDWVHAQADGRGDLEVLQVRLQFDL